MAADFHVFLSHNSKDKALVREIAARLTSFGLKPWLDVDELRPGLPWQDGLEEAMRTTGAAAVFLGGHGLGSWQKPEIRFYLSQMVERGQPVIPVLLPGAPDKPEIGLFLRENTWVDLRQGLSEEGLNHLIWGITGEMPRSRPTSNREPVRLLIVAANPAALVPLQLAKEAQEIQASLERSNQRFLVRVFGATRPSDLSREILKFRPKLVHFSGHGVEQGLVLEDDAGEPKIVSAQALASLFELFSDHVECVVLNHCFSLPQAEAIARHVRGVVGVPDQISDEAAIAFSSAFYTALGEGPEIKFAFRFGVAQLRLEGVLETSLPVLFFHEERPRVPELSSQAPPAASSPQVFLSYSHDSREHEDRVLVLCDRLRADGIDAWIDQYETAPPEGWPRWCARRVAEADFVLVICSETYERRFRGAEEPGRGLGVQWEGYVVVQELYDAGARNGKFIPIFFPPATEQQIPVVLRGATRYDVSGDEGYQRLVRHLTGQPELMAPPLGKPVSLPPRARRSEPSQPLFEPQKKGSRSSRSVDDLAAAKSLLKERVIAGQDTKDAREQVRQVRRDIRDGIRLQPGDFLGDGRFHLLEVLGRGGFAAVWKAWDEGKTCLVAVKVLHGQHREDRSRRERFFRGARRMAELHHPGIVRVFEEHLEWGGHHYFVMEYVEGGDLREAVLAGKLSAERILPLILEIGEALAFAHGRGIIHRDVKPANVLLDGDRPKLTDFDLVRAFDSTGGTQTQGHLGTFLYSAPEVLENAKEAGVAADVYSLAMTAVFAFYGRDLPPDVWRQPEVFIKKLPCSAALRDALRYGIAWKPEERPGSIGELCQALRQPVRTGVPKKPKTK